MPLLIHEITLSSLSAHDSVPPSIKNVKFRVYAPKPRFCINAVYVFPFSIFSSVFIDVGVRGRLSSILE